MTQAKPGDTVKVNYTGKLKDGRVFDTSFDREPIEFKLGEGNIIPGFENAVRGMEPGDQKTITIPADDAYGPHRDEMEVIVERDQFPDEFQPQVGEQLQISQPDGESVIVTVTNVSPESVTLDANHPLAGQDLEFDIQLVDIAG